MQPWIQGGAAPQSATYHVTPKRNLRRIAREGLIPKRGSRSRALNEKEAAVFVFPALEACKDAVAGWLGESFPEETELVILEVAIPPGTPTKSDASFEIAVLGPIPPAYIRRLFLDAPGGLTEAQMPRGCKPKGDNTRYAHRAKS